MTILAALMNRRQGGWQVNYLWMNGRRQLVGGQLIKAALLPRATVPIPEPTSSGNGNMNDP
jgi:hypothetical protein